MSVVIEFDKPADFLNMNDRTHWRAKAKTVKAWRAMSFWHACAIDFKDRPLGARCLVTIDLPVRSVKQRRDPSNLYPTLKACIDGLTDAGFWPDDDSKHVVTSEPSFHQGGNTVRVTITELPA